MCVFKTIIHSAFFKLAVLFLTFLILVGLRMMAGTFGISPGYPYVVLVSLTGFWPGVRGGHYIITAFLSSLIFVYELGFYGNLR